MKSKVGKIAILASVIFLAACSTPTKNFVSEDYEMTADEKKSLGAGFVQYFSEDLPTYAYDAVIMINEPIEKVSNYISKGIDRDGIVIEHRDSKIVGRVGSGTMNMNPAGILVSLETTKDGTKVIIRAVAKEGKVKQNTSGKAVERLIEAVKSYSKSEVYRIK